MNEYTGPMFVGQVRFRNRWRGVRTALRCLWNAFMGYELAGYAHKPSQDAEVRSN